MSRRMTKPTKWRVPSKDSDQPGHLPILIRAFACAQWVPKDPWFLHADSEESDQTGGMPRLIWVFAGHTGHFIGFVTQRLIFLPWMISLLLKDLLFRTYLVLRDFVDTVIQNWLKLNFKRTSRKEGRGQHLPATCSTIWLCGKSTKLVP